MKAAAAAAWGHGVTGPGGLQSLSQPGAGLASASRVLGPRRVQSLSRASQKRFCVCVCVCVCSLSQCEDLLEGSCREDATGLPGKGDGTELGVPDGVLFPLFQGELHPPWLLGPGPGHMAEMGSWGSS